MRLPAAPGSRRTLPKRLGGLLALAAAAIAVVALTPAGNATPDKVAANSQTFADSTAEDVNGPDVSTIVVSNDDQGNLTFVVNIPNRPTLTGDMAIIAFVDTDANAATGNANLLGADYVIELDGPLEGSANVTLFRWNGTDFSSGGVPQSSLIFSYANGATIKISAADLGATKKFNFLVLALTGLVLTPTGDVDDTNSHADIAPDQGHGTFAYEVKLTPPKLVVKSFSTKPIKPKAGRPFTAGLVFGRSDGSAPTGTETVACRATIAGLALKPTSKSLVNGRASCTWAIPKTAKGQTIRGTVTVSSAALKAAKSFTAKVG